MRGTLSGYRLSPTADAGLVLDDKRGKFIYYELNLSVVDEILGWLSALTGGTCLSGVTAAA